MTEVNIRQKRPSDEHILVCLSASPSNARIINTAAKMASAFGGSFTALYVRTRHSDRMDEEDKRRLDYHIRLAERLGASITTVYGEDVSLQIAEFARISGVTKIVIGRTHARRRHFWSKPTLTEKLTEIAPGMDIHIIPDNPVKKSFAAHPHDLLQGLIPRGRDLLVTLVILLATTLAGLGFYRLGLDESNIITLYVLGVLLTSLFTGGYICGVLGSLAGTVLFNFFFTEPRLTLHAHDSGQAVTLVIMLVASVIAGALASKLKNHAALSAQAAFRTKVLLDTGQLLQKAGDDEVFDITAAQLIKLLNRRVVIYPAVGGRLEKGRLFSPLPDEDGEAVLDGRERRTAEWVLEHRHRAGATTGTHSRARGLYLAIRINDRVYGVVGVIIDSKPLDSFEDSLLLSVLGECALALDNSRNAKEKEQAAVLAKNEQLRANLLRAISHDLRTPLTSISGNAANLLSNYESLDARTRRQIFADIHDDSRWLINLVENLLSVTRIEDGRMSINMTVELMEEVIEEAMKHIDRKSSSHVITVDRGEELLLARMDAKLIVQVIINLVDNAVKYTPEGSHIDIRAGRGQGFVWVSISDDGPGIPDEQKPRVFEMFYTGDRKIADSRRSLGLGLALCRSIINAHGGQITLTDNEGGGSVFSFRLPSGEVKINE